MAQAKFILKEPKSKEDTLIYLFYNFNNQRLKYSFNQKINPKYWNFEKQRIKETKVFPEYPEFNSMLNNLETTVNNIYRRLINDNVVPTSQVLREELNLALTSKQKVKTEIDFFEFISNFIENSTKSKGTIVHYKQTFRLLKDYSSNKKKTVSFNDINLDFYEIFVSYLREKGYAENTIGAFIKDIKVFMNEAFERNLTSNVEYKSNRFKKPQEITDKIYLNLDEVQKMYDLDLSKNKRLEKVRDLFVIGCYTGLRFSDLSQITSKDIINNGTQFKVKTEKTGELVVIPLHKTIKEIIQKYDNEIPPALSNQKMNDYIKEVAELAGIKDTVSLSITKGGEKQTTTCEKWEQVTVHTARRSFATNMYLLDIPTISIMKITGHRTEKAFLLYIKISQEENANKLLNHPFFKQ